MGVAIFGNNTEININYNYDLEFQQLKAYYNFRIDFKKKLKEKKALLTMIVLNII